jgi:protein TonB
MSDDDAPKPQVLPPLGDHRPMRVEHLASGGTQATIPLELSPNSDRPESVPAGPPLELPAADPESAPVLATSRRPIRRMVSLIAASGAHVFVLLALVSAPPVEFGYGGTELDAISVSIVPASAVVARQAVADAAAQAAPSPIAPEPGEDSTTSKPAAEKSAVPEQSVRPPLPEQATPDTSLAAPSEVAPEAAPELAADVRSPPKPPEEIDVATADPPPRPLPTEKPVEDAPRDERPTPPSPDAQSAGGATAQGAAPDLPPEPAAAAASRGEIHAYGTAVQMALLAVDQREAKARVSASGAKGTVVVRISLDDKGTLVSAEITKSSGRPHLDDAALLLIRLASFPAPPPGLTADQRSYIAPIRFQ